MKESRPDWYERMKTGPFRERTFTEERMKEVVAHARAGKVEKRYKGWFVASGVGLLAAVLAMILVLQPTRWFGETPEVLMPPGTIEPIITPQPSATLQPTPTQAEEAEPLEGVFYVIGETGAYAEPNVWTMEGPENTVKPGVPLTVKDSVNGFALVEQAGSRLGWVNDWYLTRDKVEASVNAVTPYLMLVGDPVSFSLSPMEAVPTGFKLGAGRVVRIYKEYQDWVCVSITTYDQPYGGEFWLRKSELADWDPALAREGVIREGADVRDSEGNRTELGILMLSSVNITEVLEDGRYRIGAAGGFVGYVQGRDFIPNPFLAHTEFRRLLSNQMTWTWHMTSAEFAGYEKFAANRDEELLRGLSPIEVFRYYVQASMDNDWETQYALYIHNADYGAPDYERYMREVPEDAETLLRGWQLWERLKLDYRLAEEVEQLEDGYALIRMTPFDRGTGEEEMGFQIHRNAAGIWKVGWMPMQ
ncbi:SH3 domain-containing protein [Paenibacillus sp. strain BS8-2]